MKESQVGHDLRLFDYSLEDEAVASSSSSCQDFEEAEVSVLLNTELLCGEDGEDFANWQGVDFVERQLTLVAQRRFFERVLSGDSVKVIGIKEFPYTGQGELKGGARLIERELWFENPEHDHDVNSKAPYVILHVHFSGKWHEDENMRDW
jgi:hypothetical protein